MKIEELQDETQPLILAKPTEKLMVLRLRSGKYQMHEDGLYRRCSKCGDYWPADSEFFYASRNMPDGLVDWCKACYIEWRWPNGRSIKTPQRSQTHEVRP